MTTVSIELIKLVENALKTVPALTVKDLILPELTGRTGSKYAKFGLLQLVDDSCGFYYRLPEPGDGGMVAPLPPEQLRAMASDLRGAPADEVARLLLKDDNFSRGIGMAAVNAVTQSIFQRTGYQRIKAVPEPASLPEPAIGNIQHIGMVGYFGPLINRLREQHIPITVLELDESLFTESDGLTVTGDVSRLAQCNHIICSASTLINQSLDSLLQALGDSTEQFVELVGPTCGCFPDPLFDRGIDRVGGSDVIDLTDTVDNIRRMQPWGAGVRKFQITPGNYPGFDVLMNRINSNDTTHG